MRFALILFVLLGFPACAHPEPQPIKSIYWSDGDSGRLTLESGEVIKFRLKDVDAPETGGVGAIGGAKCEAERMLGFEAKEFMVNLSRQPLAVSRWFGPDQFDRELVSLTVQGSTFFSQSIHPTASALAIRAGHLRRWDYDAGNPKPDWC